MKIKEAFTNFFSEVKLNNPDKVFDETIDETTYNQFSDTFTKHILKIFQKDETLFSEPLIVFGVDISDNWVPTYWKFLQRCAVLSLLNGNIEDKIKELIPMASTVYEEITGKSSDEIDGVLNDDVTSTKLVDIVNFLKESSLIHVFLSFFEVVDFSEISTDMNIDPNNLTPESIKNNPAVARIQEKFANHLQSKMRSGEVSQIALAQDIQTLMVKFQQAFGELVGVAGRQSNVAPQVVLGNSPEARRARMIERMRRKLEDNRKKN
jgi:hypothetical protein